MLRRSKVNFFDIDRFEEKFDCILFFESFHHCENHNLLLSKIERVLKPGGKIVFGAEPITTDFPIPWGLRMDGQSLWAIRKNGWLELGFNRKYFTEALSKLGFFLDYFEGKDGPWSHVAIAKRKEDYNYRFDANSGMKTEVGSVESGNIKGSKMPGYLMYGPYESLEKGNYEFSVDFSYPSREPLKILFDIVSENNSKNHFSREFSLDWNDGFIKSSITLNSHTAMLEVRIFATHSDDLILHGVNIHRID
jgi:hypothetical protein